MVAKTAAAASLTTPAAAGRSQLDACPSVDVPPAGSAPNSVDPPRTRVGPTRAGRHTLHIEYAVWTKTFRLVHTRPDGSRDIHRRGLPNLRDAKIRAQVAADLTGWTLHD